MFTLSRYPEVLESAAISHEPHQIAHYLRELANDFHAYYNAHQFLVEDAAAQCASDIDPGHAPSACQRLGPAGCLRTG